MLYKNRFYINKEIASLYGVEDFTSLTRLDYQRNNSETLVVPKNMALTYLSCSENQLTSLNKPP